MRKYHVKTGLVVLLVIGALAIWWQERQQPAAANTGPASAGATTEVAAPAVEGQAVGRAPASEALLPPEMESLRALAEAGDHVAGCRLGTKLLYCASAEHSTTKQVLRALRLFEQEATEAGNLKEANNWAEQLARSVALARECEGVPDESSRLGYHYLRQSALAGNPDAVLLHASGDGLASGRDGLSILRDGRFDQWRSEAPAMLHSQMEKGDPAALLALLRGYHGNSRLSWVLAPDPDRSLALIFLAEMVFDRKGFFPPLEPPPREQLRRARGQAQRWHARYFEGKTFKLQPHQRRLKAPVVGRPDEPKPSFACAPTELAS